MRSYKKLKQIKNITLLFIIGVILAFTTTVLYLALQDKKENISQQIELQKIKLELIFTKKISQLEAKYLEKLENFINTNDSIIDAFASRDRKTLAKLVDVEFNNLIKDEPNFEIICFGLPTMKSFYRAHAPSHYGDNIMKIQGIEKVTKLHKRVSGFIMSKIGIYYRVTFPVFKESKYIGLISFGINLNYVNDFIAEEFHTPSAIVVETTKLKQTKWFDRLEEGSFGKYTIISSTGDIVEVASKTDLKIDLKDERFEYENKIYNIVNNIDVLGLNNNPVAKVILFQDITKELKTYDRYLYIFVIILVILIVILLSVLILSFNKFLTTITAMNSNLEDLNLNLEKKVEIRTYDLELEKENVEKILANILLPVLITSKKDRKIVYANKYAERQYEKPLDEIIGSSIDTIYSVKNQQNHIIDILEEFGFVENLEEVYKTSTGKQFTALLSVSPIFYKEQECYIGMVTDITKQKDMENEIRAIIKQTKDSIEYASLIQGALIPNSNLFIKYFNDYFTIWKPKDIVGGDIYFIAELESKEEILVMVIDGAGHGVPGAFLTMLVKAIETQILSDISVGKLEANPALVLEYFNKSIKTMLNQKKGSKSNAGFDGGVLYYNKRTNKCKYAGAKTPLYIINDNKLDIIKSDRKNVGFIRTDIAQQYTLYDIDIKKNTKLYIATDGLIDQEGKKDRRYGKSKFENLILKNNKEKFNTQSDEIINNFIEFKDKFPQSDDITIIGIEFK